jgi:4-amino-4-deoxy-L-arabinose transferase-like glycosyltransferase
MPAWSIRLALLTAICGSVATWFRFLLTTIGGADSYGYVSASQLIASGKVIDAAPIAGWLSAANRLAIASPLGWAPAVDGSGIVPTYPLGLPILMAAFSGIAGTSAVFFVSPVLALVTLLLVYRIAREWCDAEVALLAAAVVAWNPVFIAYAKQPMSDVPASGLVIAALFLALRSGPESAFFAGVCAGAAVLTRPVLLVAAAIVPLSSRRGTTPALRVLLAVAGMFLGVAIQMAIQRKLFGSPFATGYGDTGVLFSFAHYGANVRIFARHGWEALGFVWLAALIVGLPRTPIELRWPIVSIAVGVITPYLFYLPFDHWETLRFILPALVPLSIVVAAGVVHVARLLPNPAAAAGVIALFMVPFVGRSEGLLRESSAWDIAALESRYPLAGEWIDVNTPTASVVLANQHSGSLRWYGKRQTLRWDFLAPEQLATTVRELESHGAATYVALEGDEVAMFDQRFKDVIGELQVDHVGSIRNVSFRRLR